MPHFEDPLDKEDSKRASSLMAEYSKGMQQQIAGMSPAQAAAMATRLAGTMMTEFPKYLERRAEQLIARHGEKDPHSLDAMEDVWIATRGLGQSGGERYLNRALAIRAAVAPGSDAHVRTLLRRCGVSTAPDAAADCERGIALRSKQADVTPVELGHRYDFLAALYSSKPELYVKYRGLAAEFFARHEGTPRKALEQRYRELATWSLSSGDKAAAARYLNEGTKYSAGAEASRGREQRRLRGGPALRPVDRI